MCCRSEKWGWRLPGHLLLHFWVWEMAVMSSIGYFHTSLPSSPLSLSLLISFSETDSGEAEDTFDAQPRRGIFHRDWCQRGHLRLVKTQMGRYSDWHVAPESRVRSSSDGPRQIHQDGRQTDTIGAGCQPHANLLFHSGDLTVTVLPDVQYGGPESSIHREKTQKEKKQIPKHAASNSNIETRCKYKKHKHIQKRAASRNKTTNTEMRCK